LESGSGVLKARFARTPAQFAFLARLLTDAGKLFAGKHVHDPRAADARVHHHESRMIGAELPPDDRRLVTVASECARAIKLGFLRAQRRERVRIRVTVRTSKRTCRS
jgi:hypothetical protein